MGFNLRLVWLALLVAVPCAGRGPVCAACHPKQAEGFARTGMGRSFGRPAESRQARFQHALSGSRFEVRGSPAGMIQRIERDGLSAEYPVAYSIGSGNHGVGYLIRRGGYLFQSPVAFYTQRGIWDVAPGYENNRHPDFNRPVPSECLACHAGAPRPVAGTLNRYEDPPVAAEAIGCERCHGPPDRHLAAPARGNIVNPARLPPRLRDSVCEQCHLSGEARVLNPGREWLDFTPGEELEETFSVYVPAGEAAFKVVSHVEQLRLSSCAAKSEGRLWCGTCHDPHQPPAEPARYYRERCRTCHDAESILVHAQPSGDCAACHMQTRQSWDSGHAAMTDHRIRRRPVADAPLAAATGGALTAWREPPGALAARNLGLAYISAGERDQSLEQLQEGYRILAGLGGSFEDDPEVLAGMGLVLLLKDRPAEAARLFERAVARKPAFGPYYVKLATAWKMAGRNDRAIEALERAIAADPSIEAAYHLLAELSPGEARRRALQRYLEFMPQSLIGRAALR